MRRGAIALMLALWCALVIAQVDGVPRDIIEQRIEAAAEQLGGEADLSNLFEILTDRYLDPIDLNRTDAQELSTILLLNDVQISDILQHRQRFGRFLNIYELQTLNSMDPRTIRLIEPFVLVRDNPLGSTASLKEILKNGTNEITLRSTMNIESRRGFLDRPNAFGKPYAYPNGDELPDIDDPAVVDSLRRNNKVYLGSPFRVYTRYRFRYRQNISFGFTAEKDEGEQFFKGTQPNGYDFYSAHFFLRNIGRLKALAIGDYQAQFGQGLTFWNGLGFAAKSSFTMNVKRNAPGLAPYTSVNENLFLRGVAATFEVGRHFEVTAFGSRKDIDANVQTASDAAADSLGTVQDVQIIASSFLEDGFHRTYTEVSRKDALGETILGGHVAYKRSGMTIGATAARVEYTGSLQRNSQVYNQFDYNGGENTTAGVDWNVLHRNLTWFGEAATSANGGMAMNTGLLLSLDKRVSMSLLYRNYGRDYHGLYSVAFAEGTNPWNERGLFTGLEVRPNRQWTINAYFDQFSFPWLRYLTDAPSTGFDWLAQVNWRPSKQVEIYARARHQDRARNTADDVDGVDPLVRVEQTNYRVNATYKVSNSVSLRSRVETVDFQRGSAALRHGFLVYQDIVHRPLSSPVELTLRFALFDTESYDARIYAYENDLIGVFSIPPYYGRGIRWYGMVRVTPLRRVDIWLRYGAFIYNDQSTVSSGLQEINGNMRSDLKAQVRWIF
ncbi:MAG TPA: helix-hairpin-helix domain-containing protein [Flavobacteriales bacterium]|nr:helix-hairpin-helix domain-containing protein [Flavobacteriales bacterium]